MSAENKFKFGDKVRNLKTGETGVVAPTPNALRYGHTPVIYDDEVWGTVYETPTHKLELIPDDEL